MRGHTGAPKPETLDLVIKLQAQISGSGQGVLIPGMCDSDLSFVQAFRGGFTV